MSPARSIRIHPAIIAQAAATVGCLMPGRFFLGVGTGENLNEHILGDGWPEHEVRAEMLEEAVDVIRLLWQGDQASHHGRLLHRRERADLRRPGPTAADPRRGRRATRRRCGRADRRRADRDGAGAGARGRLPERRRQRQTDVRPSDVVLGRVAGRGGPYGAQDLANGGDPRGGEPGAAGTRSFRTGSRRW